MRQGHIQALLVIPCITLVTKRERTLDVVVPADVTEVRGIELHCFVERKRNFFDRQLFQYFPCSIKDKILIHEVFQNSTEAPAVSVRTDFLDHRD